MTVPPPHQPPPEDPHEGSEDDPRRELDPMDEHPVVPPRRYESSDVDRPIEGTVEAAPPTTMDRIIAVSWPLSIAAFMVLGFTTGMWYIVWLVILIPWALSAWHNPNED